MNDVLTVTLDIRVEFVDDGKPVWWADASEVDGFYAAADSMEGLRAQAGAALTEILGTGVRIIERIAGHAEDRSPVSVAVAQDHRLLLDA